MLVCQLRDDFIGFLLRELAMEFDAFTAAAEHERQT
jgi:hypothetical protein